MVIAKSGKPHPTESLFASGDESSLLHLLEQAPDPLAAVLDLLLRALGATFVLFVEVRSGQGKPRSVGRRAPGRPIILPERLLRPEIVRQVVDHGGPLLLDPNPGNQRCWLMGCPTPLDRKAEATILVEGPTPLSPEIRTRWRGAMARSAPWISLAQSLGVRRENRALNPEMHGSRHRDPSAPGSPPAAHERHARPGSSLSSGTDHAGKGDVRTEFPSILAHSSGMQDVLRTVTLVADSEASILIEGESGTGKELIARAIHQKSRRHGFPFISENCAACPEGLLESEFFGVERGAFTGAHRSKPGLFERAQKGTLFLDEIGEMDLRLQVKLLRVLQEREVRRVGGSELVPVDFRLICATNRVLSEEGPAGRFRMDLLYRIEVVKIQLPPLRERREEVPYLASHFLAVHSRNAGVAPPSVDDAAMELLCSYSWPGNVREIENEMWRAVALGVNAITKESLSPKIQNPVGDLVPPGDHRLTPGRSLKEMEREILGRVIRDVLYHTDGNKIRAARILGIPKTSLYRRLRRYGIAYELGKKDRRDG